jgi:hypothetical protein
VLYQLVSGKLLNLSWKVWVTRDERPQTYWIVLAAEATAVMFGVCLGIALWLSADSG